MKNELIQKVANRTGKSQKEVKEIVEAFLDEVKNQLKDGQKVAIQMFGTFTVRQRKAGVAHHPVTKQEIQIPARKAMHFKASQKLRDWLNG